MWVTWEAAEGTQVSILAPPETRKLVLQFYLLNGKDVTIYFIEPWGRMKETRTEWVAQRLAHRASYLHSWWAEGEGWEHLQR